ncbi:TetR/AcrR family transcriptional regulator [Kineococcus rubinsiae]|uniref:TetR/AcrR family transcriptional regulator n=1 Tax=Kineococcus rubinsiae TaxID=2609562 RepID=UPI0014308FF1|nr:TetR/AcrR family transcriptional regulator [Kineococcus rubinsiae]NIZ91944.1 helix-turn-helix transcriptional regulator [Kineococcus rubinsiae]
MTSTPRRAPSPDAAVDLFGDPVAAAAARHLALAPAASMQELAEAAGVSRATLFRRFPSRTALVAELCGAAAEAYVRAVEGAAPGSGNPREALARVVAALGRLAAVAGLLGLQPLQEHVEAALLARTAQTEDSLRRLARRGQESGDFRVEVDPEWFVSMLTWLLVGAADSVRLGRLTAAAAQRHVAATIEVSLTRVSRCS